MTTSTPGTPPAPVWRIAVLARATILALLAVRADTAPAAIDGVPLPAAAGSTWEVVAGYNTYTHVGADPHALDIVRVDADTAGSEVRAPVAGKLAISAATASPARTRTACGTSSAISGRSTESRVAPRSSVAISFPRWPPPATPGTTACPTSTTRFISTSAAVADRALHRRVGTERPQSV